MKQMTLVFCALMIFPGWASTQDLILTKGNSEKKFPAGQFVLVSTLAGDTAVSGLCSQNYYYGKLLNSEFGVLTIQVSYSHTPLNTESLIIGTGFNRTFFGNTSDGPIISIPKDEVIWVRKSGKNKPKNNNTGETIGGSLALAGFVVLTGSLIE